MAKLINYKMYTFEQLCVRKEIGFSFDLNTMFMPSDPSNFDDVVFKIISKIDTSLLLLDNHGVEVEKFTIIAIPLKDQCLQGNGLQKLRDEVILSSKYSSLHDAWVYLSSVGWHCLQCLVVIQPNSLPNNGSRRYSLYHYTTSIMDVIRSNYMFQKFHSNFDHETLEMFDEEDMKGATLATVGLLWRSNLSIGKPLSSTQISKQKLKKYSPPSTPPPLSPPKKRKSSQNMDSRKRRSPSINGDSDIENFNIGSRMDVTEIDEEISIKNVTPSGVESASSSRGRRGKKSTKGRISNQSMDVTLGFEHEDEPRVGRKSTAGRKSLSSEWPEDERINILRVFDNLNPDVSEQKRIALTCKYVTVQLGKDLPSKLLYQWVQKKGRVIERSITSFSLPEKDHKSVALNFFHELEPNNSSEASRVNFTLKYLDTQYGVRIPSKQLYLWLSEKPKTSSRGKK